MHLERRRLQFHCTDETQGSIFRRVKLSSVHTFDKFTQSVATRRKKWPLAVTLLLRLASLICVRYPARVGSGLTFANHEVFYAGITTNPSDLF